MRGGERTLWRAILLELLVESRLRWPALLSTLMSVRHLVAAAQLRVLVSSGREMGWPSQVNRFPCPSVGALNVLTLGSSTSAT